jgi:hypothetical protein
VSLVGFRASNHPQQVDPRGADDEIDDRGTPQDFWDELNERYHFTLDVAAAPHNAKCANYYTRLADGLLQPWTGRCGATRRTRARRWLEKAWTEWNGRPPTPHLRSS